MRIGTQLTISKAKMQSSRFNSLTKTDYEASWWCLLYIATASSLFILTGRALFVVFAIFVWRFFFIRSLPMMLLCYNHQQRAIFSPISVSLSHYFPLKLLAYSTDHWPNGWTKQYKQKMSKAIGTLQKHIYKCAKHEPNHLSRDTFLYTPMKSVNKLK